MRRVSAIGLTLAMCGQPGFAAAADDLVMRGPIGRSVSREASRLAIEPSGQAKDAGWESVRNLDPARPIVITTAAATVTRTFVAVDNTTLTVLNLSRPGLSETATRQLLALTRASPPALAGAADGSPKLFEAFRFGPDGVFQHEVKVAEFGELIERVPIGDVLAITAPVRRGSAAAAVLGTLAGSGLERRWRWHSPTRDANPTAGALNSAYGDRIRRMAREQPSARGGHLQERSHANRDATGVTSALRRTSWAYRSR